VAQNKTAPLSGASKFSLAFWREGVFRRTYTHGGREMEVAGFRARIQHAGRREELGLHTNDREAAARAAVKGVPTVGDVIKGASKTGDIAAITLRGYSPKAFEDKSANGFSKMRKVSPTEAVAAIRAGKWARQIAALRSATGADRDRLKRCLPAFLWAGKFTGRNNKGIESYSGLLCADRDKTGSGDGVRPAS